MPVNTTQLVSVLLPVYNGECYLAEAVDSILAQSHEQFELLLIDDGSTDTTRMIIESYAGRDARVKPIHSAHGGLASALKQGIKHVTGAFIARMDADDWAYPERFEKQLGWMAEKGIDVCGSWVEWTDRHGHVTQVKRFATDHEEISFKMLFTCPLLDPAMMMRATVLREVPYTEHTFLEDHALLIDLAPKFRLGNIPEVLLKHRRHPGQITRARRAGIGLYQRYLGVCHFKRLFPEAPAEDIEIFKQIWNLVRESVDPPPSTDSIETLYKMARFFNRYFKTGNPFARNKLAGYWRRICLSFSTFGSPGLKVFIQTARELKFEYEGNVYEDTIKRFIVK